MTIQQKATGRASSIPAGLAAGAAVSVLVTLAVCMIGGWMIGSEMIPQEQTGYCAITALLASVILGSMAACKKTRRKKLAVCLSSAGIYYAILVAITIIFFDGSFQGMGVTLVTVVIGSLIALLLTNRGEKRSSGKRMKKIHR